ncbi:hypothetical protein Q5P01_004937 [Channa striata]|uniref:Uncharacterized protein n=1 Tax=Channa striata TaxID=64152 RepID=A0AA88NCU0_CHASR|nr:hypothetical protein Q5P01_004937 [Channa striata]
MGLTARRPDLTAPCVATMTYYSNESKQPRINLTNWNASFLSSANFKQGRLCSKVSKNRPAMHACKGTVFTHVYHHESCAESVSVDAPV